MLRTIQLHGHLAEMCGTDSVELVGNDIRVLVNGLCSRFGYAVKQYIKENNFTVLLKQRDGGFRDISTDEVSLSLGSTEVVQIVPVVEGGGRVGQIIAGIVLISVGMWVTDMTFNSATPIGQGLISSGIGLIVGAIMGPGAPKAREAPDERASFLFNGAVNTLEQGSPVPIVYGRFRTGSVVVSAGIDAETIMSYTSPIEGNAAPDTDFGVITA